MAETLNPTPLCRCCHKNGDFKCLFSDFIYEIEVENYSHMLYDTFGILFVPFKHDRIYTICDECIEKLRISTEFKNHVLACKTNIKREPLIENDETFHTEEMWINACSDKEEVLDESNQDVKVEEDGNKSDELDESEEPLIADDNKVTREETANYEDHNTSINRVLDEESNEDVISEKNENESLCEYEVSLRNSSDRHENKCSICNKTFKRKGNLESHLTTHDGYKCQICLEILSNQREYSKHFVSKHVVDGKYCCINCDESFLELKKLKCHIKMHFRNRCDVCDKDYKSNDELRSHEVVHKDERNFKCSICNNMFAQHQSFKAHMETHRRTPYECQECGRKFTAKESLVKHCENVHMGVKKYSCQYCDKRTTTKQSLVIHERTHTGVKPYVCEKCYKSFTTKGDLLRHNSVHLAHKPHICKVCDKAYKTKRTLKMHMLRHTEIKPFQCSVCCKTFVHKNHLNAHMNVHNGDRPYKCDICKKAFKYKINIRRHFLAAHLDLKPPSAKCNICKKTYFNKYTLRSHTLAVHLGFKPTPTECDICKKTYSNKQTLRTHMSTVHFGFKSIECDICKKRFKSKRSIYRHMSTVHLGFKSIECDICKKTFKYKHSLRSHMLAVHLSFKPTPTACDICKKTYYSKSTLRRHMSTVHLGFKPTHDKGKDI